MTTATTVRMRRFPAIILMIVALEAILVLFLLGQWHADILGGDGNSYHQVAVNLSKYFKVSYSSAFPIEPSLYRPPGYSAFLALIYSIGEYSIPLVRVVQFLLIFLTAYWLFRLVLSGFDARTAKLSSLLLATYPPVVFLAAFHLTEVLTTCIAVGLILIVEKYRAGGSVFTLGFGLGMASGALALVRPSMALSLPVIVVGLFLTRMFGKKQGGHGGLWAGVAAPVFGFVLILSPWLVRNVLLTGKPVLGAGSGESLYFSALQYNGEISYAFTAMEWQERYFPEMRTRREAISKRVNSDAATIPLIKAGVPASVVEEMLLGEDFRQSAVEVFKQLTPTQVIRSIPIRVAYLWSTCDFSPQALQQGVFHRFMQLHYVVLVLCAILGILLRWRRLPEEWPLWLFPVYLTAVHLIFHIEPRYSLPGRPFILIYSAVGMIGVYDWARTCKGVDREKHV